MTKNDLLKQVKMNSSDMLEILECNPKQVISDTIEIPVWKIKYSYYTARGNLKNGVKYIFLPKDGWDLIDQIFNTYIDNYNREYPYKKISNVKILDSEYMGILCLELR